MLPEFRPTRAVLERRWGDLGFEELLPEERDYIVLWWLEAEVLNGGFSQYFFNSSGDAAPEALVALQGLGAERSAHILRTAIGLLDCDPYIRDTAARREHLLKVEDAGTSLDGVTDELDQLPDDFVSLAIARVKAAYAIHGVS